MNGSPQRSRLAYQPKQTLAVQPIPELPHPEASESSNLSFPEPSTQQRAAWRKTNPSYSPFKATQPKLTTTNYHHVIPHFTPRACSGSSALQPVACAVPRLCNLQAFAPAPTCIGGGSGDSPCSRRKGSAGSVPLVPEGSLSAAACMAAASASCPFGVISA
jgi:hypothetical protein